ncbi:hypothetical protein RsoM2USA_405 [Ralstonia phage RsoM2USA]|nr:hypothetical protein RsoM2USA_405 [Ralstonia phage RsoM2USA]
MRKLMKLEDLFETSEQVEKLVSNYKKISEETVLKYLKSDFKNSFDVISETPLYRGLPSNEAFFFVDPKQLSRTEFQSNLYTLIIDNSEEWENFPKRSESVIATTDFQDTKTYGTPYYVIPMDGFKLGCCSADEIDDSFQNAMKEVGKASLSEFCDSMKDLLWLVTGCNREDLYTSEATLRKVCRRFDAAYSGTHIKEFLESKSITSKNKMFDETMDDIGLVMLHYFDVHYEGDVYAWIEHIINPEENALFVEDNYVPGGYVEVWTDSPCIFVHEKKFKEIQTKLGRNTNGG